MPYRNKAKANESARRMAAHRRPKNKKRKYQYRKKIKDYIQGYKEAHSCEICGESRTVCLDFHHKDKQAKDYNIAWAAKNCGLTRIKKEIAKCMVVCANCHRVIHEGDSGENIKAESEYEKLPLFD